jgi:hypothetical protein
VGNIFFHVAVDAYTVLLLVLVWAPFCLPYIRKLKFKEFEIELEERLKQVQKEITTLANTSEMATEKASPGFKYAPQDIRVRYRAARSDAKWFRVTVWIEAPAEFRSEVSKVVYERHASFTNPRKEIVQGPAFTDTFRCWGEFTIKAEIHLRDGTVVNRRRYLSFSNAEDDVQQP